MKSSVIDINEDLLVQRWKAGVKLIKPDNYFNKLQSPSIKHLFKMPFNVYFLNTESVIQNMSDTTAYTCGFQGKKDAIGKTARAVSKKESAEFSIKHNKEVITTHSIIIKDEHFQRLDNFEFHDIAIKFPLYNSDGNIMGVFGCSIMIDRLAQSLNLLMETGLLANTKMTEKLLLYPIHLNPDIAYSDSDRLGKKLNEKLKQSISKREVECLVYLMRGKSARETGMELNLSQRTVEYYLNLLKEKLHCTKKSELIELVFSLLKN